jgi:two-component system sensor histidine kinase KdpD
VDSLVGLSLRRLRPALPYAVMLLGLAALTAVLAPLRRHLTLLDVGMLYLLLVVLITTRFGLWPGIVASAVVNQSFNFFFVPPVHRFQVDESKNVVALIVFLGVTVVTSSLLARARRGEDNAHEREKEAALMFDLARGVLADPAASAVLPLLCTKVRHALSAQSAAIFLVRGDRYECVASDGTPLDMELMGDERLVATDAIVRAEARFLGGRPRAESPRLVGRMSMATPVAMVPLLGGGQRLGVLRVSGGIHATIEGADEMRLLQTFAYVAALAVNHGRLMREVTASRALKEADVLKSALLSTVSHELRTPLASIKASATSLMDGAAQWDETTRTELLAAIDQETDRLNALVSNLLDLSRLEGGALHLDRDWYDVRELVETVSGRIELVLGQRRLKIEIADSAGEALVDYVLVGQAIQNLVENAAKFSPVDAAIHIRARGTPDGLDLRVEDEGPGIPEAERDRVFEKFYRAEAVRGQVPGTGLGLAIVRGIVEAHGGRIRVERSPFGGAALVITLPPASHRAPTPLQWERSMA